MTMIALRRVGPGQYQTLDGRYTIERQDAQTECDHPLCDTLHRKWHTATGGGGSMHWISYVAWHIWDNATDDYFGGRGPSEFDTKRQAHATLTDALAAA